MQTIHTFDEAVEFLGGDKKVRDWLGLDPNHFSAMKCRAQPSRGFLLHFYLTLVARGADPKPSVFGLKTFDRLIMPKSRRAN